MSLDQAEGESPETLIVPARGDGKVRSFREELDRLPVTPGFVVVLGPVEPGTTGDVAKALSREKSGDGPLVAYLGIFGLKKGGTYLGGPWGGEGALQAGPETVTR